MYRRSSCISLVLLVALSFLRVTGADEPSPKPLTPIEARKKVGEQIVLEMTVKKAKDRLEKRGEIYLDAELDFRAETNFATVINRDGAFGFENKNVKDFEEYFLGKTIRVRGSVTVVAEIPRIEVSDSQQVEIIEKK